MMDAPSRNETRVALVLCLLAALRVFVFSAAFPFFGNMDEESHFDLVMKYARGHVPGGLERFDPDTARTIVLYRTPEYLSRPEQFPAGELPRPFWPLSVEHREPYERQVAALTRLENHESVQPPLYYAVAGAWCRIGAWMGLGGGHALYWTRLLNVFAYGFLTWLAYAFARACFPDRAFLRLGVPFLVAFFPQDVFYTVNNDVLLPLVNGAAFLCLVLVGRGKRRGLVFHAGTGLLVAAAMLDKLSSVAILPVAAAIAAFRAFRSRGAGESKAAIAGAVLMLAAAVPIGAWCARNALVLGDVTGSLGKAQCRLV